MGGNEARQGPPKGIGWGRHLRFERHGSLAHCVIDRPERRNALTAAMYFGIRYAIDRVNAEESLAGLIITGTGDVFIPGGDLGADPSTTGAGPDCWAWTTCRSTPCDARSNRWSVR